MVFFFGGTILFIQGEKKMDKRRREAKLKKAEKVRFFMEYLKKNNILNNDECKKSTYKKYTGGCVRVENVSVKKASQNKKNYTAHVKITRDLEKNKKTNCSFTKKAKPNHQKKGKG
jgi:hypothetical protein